MMTGGGWDRRFLSTTRGQVVTLLSRAARTVEELADALGVTDNAVRSHLSVLERDGLVRQHGVRRSGGKPAYVYDVTPEAEQLFPKAYGPVLGLVLDVLGERLPADAVEGLLREVAARITTQSTAAARRGGTAGERIERAVAVLEELGGTVEVEDARANNGKVRLRAYGCPLATAVPRHPEVCQMLSSVIAEVTGARVTECCEREGRPRCCFEVAFGRRRAA
jgi:predicted ArsR family transcriptional regulator